MYSIGQRACFRRPNGKTIIEHEPILCRRPELATLLDKRETPMGWTSTGQFPDRPHETREGQGEGSFASWGAFLWDALSLSGTTTSSYVRISRHAKHPRSCTCRIASARFGTSALLCCWRPRPPIHKPTKWTHHKALLRNPPMATSLTALPVTVHGSAAQIEAESGRESNANEKLLSGSPAADRGARILRTIDPTPVLGRSSRSFKICVSGWKCSPRRASYYHTYSKKFADADFHWW